MKLLTLLFALFFIGGCAKNSRDVVEDGRTLGSFEPKKDYLVDIPMGEARVMGQSSGVKILGLITLGAGQTASGVDVTHRGESTMGGSSSVGTVSALSALALAPLVSTSEKFKKAALRDACEKNNCDVLGYTMYNVNEKNYFLFKTYNVKVKGFPGKVGRLENVQRNYTIGDSYWRRPLPAIR
tara:strand:- start:326 stop:874 length:549 start_codon:yes stop_codon:yes gene_type:complete